MVGNHHDRRSNGGNQGLVVTPKALEFGMVEAGKSAAREVTIVNSGIVDLKIELITFVGEEEIFEEAHEFPELPAGRQNTIQVKFSPASAGAKKGAMCILVNDHEDRNFYWLEISLSGQGGRAGSSVGLTRFIKAHRGPGRSPAPRPQEKEGKIVFP